MRLIGLVVILAVGLILVPPTIEGQSTKIARVGILSTGSPRSAAIYQAFEQRLRELGYLEGQNLIIEFRNADGRIDRLPGFAAEMVSLNADVVVVATDPATHAMKTASSKIPVVLVSVNYDPVQLGYISSLARPATNITGVVFLHRELTAKRLELFKEMLPSIKRVGVLSEPDATEQLSAVQAANKSIGLTLQTLQVQAPSYDFEGLSESPHALGPRHCSCLRPP